MMKKISGIVILVVGVMAIVVGALTFYKIGSYVPPEASIIGGADGPTTVFLAGRIGLPVYGTIAGGVVLMIVGILLLIYRKDKEQ